MEYVTRVVNIDDVKDVLFDMSPHKAPGIDGFPAFFFQKGWNKLKGDLLNFVTRAFTDGCLPNEVTDSLVVLIPKVSPPKRITQFRCSVFTRLRTS